MNMVTVVPAVEVRAWNVLGFAGLSGEALARWAEENPQAWRALNTDVTFQRLRRIE